MIHVHRRTAQMGGGPGLIPPTPWRKRRECHPILFSGVHRLPVMQCPQHGALVGLRVWSKKDPNE